MNRYENMDLEFKEIYVPEIKKEVIAFANTEGGVLYVGIRKDGTVTGVDHPDEVMLQIAGSLKDSVRPDVMPFVKIRAVQKEEKTVVEVTVEVGSNRPYYLQEKGLKPSGVYVRKGSSSQPLGDEGIREMIVENSGKSYETCRSMNQNLTFETFEAEMQKRDLEFGPSQMRTLHLIGEDGLYTNLALLLSDQCEHTIKAAIFQGSDKAVFRDRKEFSGSLLKQLTEVYHLIDLFNKTKATFSGLERRDKQDYPLDAVREALLNSIVHRDYSFSGSTLINLYDDRIEFVSLGGLVPGLSMEAIFMGVSQPRNSNLAAVFYRMRLIESYGTGIGKIRRTYEKEQNQPEFDTAKGVFRVVLPNCNEEKRIEYTEERYVPFVKEEVAVEDYKAAILQMAMEKGRVKRKDVEGLLGLKQTRAFDLLKELCEDNELHAVGAGRSSYYEPVDR
ncbi:MAG: RNA-binding domain-containing protein [Lachnospiraceae bacterium]